MLYDEDWLRRFDGNIDARTIDLKELANSLEKYTSQYTYTYETNVPNYETIKIKIMNSNIPHLLGLSLAHHVGLPSRRAPEIFEGLKHDWTLQKIMQGDKGWFKDNQYKLIGVLFLYQLMRIKNCKVYTTLGSQSRNRRFKRDNIYFVIVKYPNGISYSIELTPDAENTKIFVPRSLKVNDTIESSCTEVTFNLVNMERLRVSRKISQVLWE